MTQQNAAMVEESTAASHNLAQEAQELSALIERFKVGQTAAAPLKARTPAAPRGGRPALKAVSSHVGGGGALRKPEVEVVADADRWEEF